MGGEGAADVGVFSGGEESAQTGGVLVCCRVLRCDAVCCSVLWCGVVCGDLLRCVVVWVCLVWVRRVLRQVDFNVLLVLFSGGQDSA